MCKALRQGLVWLFSIEIPIQKDLRIFLLPTVPLKGKLTVTRVESQNSTRDSILNPWKFRELSLESRVEFRNSRVGSFEFEVEKNHELAGWWSFREVNCVILREKRVVYQVAEQCQLVGYTLSCTVRHKKAIPQLSAIFARRK